MQCVAHNRGFIIGIDDLLRNSSADEGGTVKQMRKLDDPAIVGTDPVALELDKVVLKGKPMWHRVRVESLITDAVGPRCFFKFQVNLGRLGKAKEMSYEAIMTRGIRYRGTYGAGDRAGL